MTVTTGAHIALGEADGSKTVLVPTITLDSLFAERLGGEDRVLLKLDLQGWELEAFHGASYMLPLIEVVLFEVSFFAQTYEPPITSLVRLFDRSGFDLHDVASNPRVAGITVRAKRISLS